MTDHVQQAAEVMEKGGAAVALGSWAASWITWLDHHSQAVLAVCGVIGMAVGVVGLLLKAIYLHTENQRLAEDHKVRMKLLRQGNLPNGR